jgi:hypothetical protein
MRQALHILRKDARHLRADIVLVIALTIAFGATHNRGTADWRPLLAMAALVMIVRLVHAEAIPGDRQFWITRPYRWPSLLAAKLIFVVAFLSVPVLIAQTVVFVRDGFAVSANLGAVAWSNALVFFVLILPAVALASLTRSISELLVAGIGGAAAALVGFGSQDSVPGDIAWVRSALAAVTVAAAAAAVVGIQYSRRHTTLGRLVGVAAGVFALVVFLAVPVRLLTLVQQTVGPDQIDMSGVQVTMGRPIVRLADPRFRSDRVGLVLPFQVSGVADGVGMQMDAVALSLAGSPEGVRIEGRGYGSAWEARVDLSQAQFERLQGLPLRVDAHVLMTAFGDARTFDYSPSDEPTVVADQLSCRIDGGGSLNLGDGLVYVDRVECRTPARWPSWRLFAASGSRELFRRTAMSYSPFPSGLDLNAFGVGSSTIPREVDALTIRIDEPIGHLRRDVQFDLNLANAIEEVR